MNESEFLAAFSELDSRAQREYHQSLAQVVKETNEQAAGRVGRLIGVMLKEPFAEPHPLATPSARSGAYVAWELKRDNDAFEQQSATWQYRTILEICREVAPGMDVPRLCRDAHYEHGFFGYFAQTIRNYICKDKKTRKLVDDAIKAAAKGGQKLPALTPEIIVASGGLTLGVVLVQQVPILGYVGAPVIAGVVVILYTLGVDAFCRWSDGLRTDQTERD